MVKARLFAAQSQCNESIITLAKDVAHHAHKVLRIKPGDSIEICTETELITATIDTWNNNQLSISSLTTVPLPKRSIPEITLIQCLPKGDKLSDIVNHATQIGVSKFVIMHSERSVAKWDSKKQPKKFERLSKIIESAAMQSKQLKVPAIEPQCLTIDQLAEHLPINSTNIVFWEENAPPLPTVIQSISGNAPLCLLIGPEGGLSTDEIKTLHCDYDFKTASLGDTILRVEIAGVFAIAQLLALLPPYPNK